MAGFQSRAMRQSDSGTLAAFRVRWTSRQGSGSTRWAPNQRAGLRTKSGKAS